MHSGYKTVAAVSLMIILCASSLLAGDMASLEASPRTVLDKVSELSPQTRPEVQCELKVKEKYKYYDIDGADVGELRKKMNQAGTKWNDGKTYAAVTSWDIRYDYDVSYKDGRCSVKSVKTNVDIVYHLPRRVSSKLLPELTMLWDGYLTRLKEHEFGHKDIAVKTAAEINQILSSLGDFSSQSELDEEANRRAEEKFRRLKEAQVEYDVETRHGETQGAVLTDHAPTLVLNKQ